MFADSFHFRCTVFGKDDSPSDEQDDRRSTCSGQIRIYVFHPLFWQRSSSVRQIELKAKYMITT